MKPVLSELLNLSRKMGDPTANLAILAEGNASGRSSQGTFFIKASGRSLAALTEADLVEVQAEPILQAFNKDLSDQEVKGVLVRSKVDPECQAIPSVETFMHAWLLTLPDVNWVAHTHPVALLSLLSIEGSQERATQRLFPDEVVCCGPATCFVPYTDPGLPLARALKSQVLAFLEQHGEVPKTIWLANHGLITLGSSADQAWSGTLMAEKAARVWLGAILTGIPIQPMSPESISRIHTRPDEHYRQSLLWQVRGSAL